MCLRDSSTTGLEAPYSLSMALMSRPNWVASVLYRVLEKETQLNNDLKQLDYVSSVISYVHTVGASIPSDYVPSSSLSQLYSEQDVYKRQVPDWLVNLSSPS